MKLKDILARELKVWPNNYQYISFDPEVGIFAVLKGGGAICLPSIGDHNVNDRLAPHVYKDEWQAAVDALKVAEGIADAEAGNTASLDAVRNKWTIRRNGRALGEFTLGDLIECGYLPPSMSLNHQWVGRACRFESKPEWSEDGLPNVGTKCVIYKGTHGLAAGAEEFIGPVVTVTARFKSARGIEMACVDSGGDGGCHVFRADMCFHLPTAEEISFREREDAIAEMMALAGMGSRRICTALYDRNYRKQVTK